MAMSVRHHGTRTTNVPPAEPPSDCTISKPSVASNVSTSCVGTWKPITVSRRARVMATSGARKGAG